MESGWCGGRWCVCSLCSGSVDEVRLATAEWVDWFDQCRLHQYCGDIPPSELNSRVLTTLRKEPSWPLSAHTIGSPDSPGWLISLCAALVGFAYARGGGSPGLMAVVGVGAGLYWMGFPPVCSSVIRSAVTPECGRGEIWANQAGP